MTPMTNLWTHSNTETAATQPLTADAVADLVIIGAGFTGCAAALEAARAGRKAVVLEAQTIAHGGSGRNVGLVNAGLWLKPDEVVAQMGEAAGSRLTEELGKGPAAVFSLIREYDMDCEATPAGTLHLAHSQAGLADLQDRFRQGNRLGAPVQMLDRDETIRRTGSQAFHGALLDPRAGTVQPRAYCTGLARAAISLGASIHETSPVTRIRHVDGTWQVSSNGHTVTAPALLVATNAYHQLASGAYAPQYVTVNYCQFATAPMTDAQRDQVLPGGEGCWDTALVMSSVRTDRAGRLIVGGMGQSDGPGGAIHAGWARRKLAKLYPELADLPFEHAWSGRIAMTSDHVPKAVEFGPSAYAVFGFSGRGICPGTVIGTAAAKALTGAGADAMPMPVVRGYSERFTGPRSAYYEFGATLTHALNPGILG
ncbi:NAD(P)/FAD-dependent oxidoreductase [Chachezhania sediminis]|uniref:NAD(P)/FAD-dependent oxidoreductase n=1 Tax=Chachezhania sediminis TaxID=2599291 RepID=UPI00131DDC4C|nr:FAD-dependent oxidoreductase [Chachezhania sediminis]